MCITLDFDKRLAFGALKTHLRNISQSRKLECRQRIQHFWVSSLLARNRKPVMWCFFNLILVQLTHIELLFLIWW